MTNSLSIQDIYVYPIKSLGGIRLAKATVEERGFKYDRRWMLVDQKGVFLSQRTTASLALLRVRLESEGLTVFPVSNSTDQIHIPFDQVGEELAVQVWDDEMLAKTVCKQADDWFSRILGKEVRLVKMPESTVRKVDPKYAPNGEAVSFADGMPYLMIGQNSLDDLNQRLEEEIEMNRFRPNIVFSGGEPFMEDTWDEIQIGDVTFQVVKPCARCVMITIAQETGVKGKEPLKTLATYRATGKKVLFGQNMLALSSGELKVGDKLVPMSYK
ncbi:MOSC domain-containing protein [Algoriphagus halophytocola]|uniref:MOSC domain-containing protein n=1 Tax=Algoriphagus halophytocola TaxID=2991499 RepID=A0ABY6MLN3_9BACT|nr:MULTISPECIES: MOSC N-terminal beta barrel domain-containing protein [unclassified Algoriphagus]UZD24672.1 MOSC domain-containing protein [Algoriphagus sp. TR-M5]WBL42040.1 MOSC domain-containing protein [Algoriphagus sp. TR-M9]